MFIRQEFWHETIFFEEKNSSMPRVSSLSLVLSFSSFPKEEKERTTKQNV